MTEAVTTHVCLLFFNHSRDIMTTLFTKTICGILLTVATSVSFADMPKIGASINGGTFVYRDDIEGVYWVDWIAYPLMDKKTLKSSDSIHLTLVAEGKNTFVGNGNIYCSSGESDWESGNNNGSIATNENEIKEYIPKEVIKNSINQFCKK